MSGMFGMLEELIDYENDLTVDKGNLDQENFRQPNLVWIYSVQLEEAAEELRDAEEDLLDKKYELDKVLRTDFKTHGFDKKPTEAAITITIPAFPAYKELQAKVRDKQHRLNLCKRALNAIEAKKRTIEQAIQLLNSNYFAGPEDPKDVQRDWKKTSTKEALVKRMKKRRLKKDNGDS